MKNQVAVWILLSLMTIGAFATPKAENVYFIIFDDMNDWVGYLSREGRDNTLKAAIPDDKKRNELLNWLTPNMDKLASGGVAFTQAQANFPLCGPSRTSFLSGLLPTTTAYYSNEANFREVVPNADQIVTLPEHLKNNDFLVVEAGKVFHKQRGGQPETSHPQSDPQSWSVQHVLWCGLWWNFPPVHENGKDYRGNPWRYAPETTYQEYKEKGEKGSVMPNKDRWHNGIFTVDYFADNFHFGAMPGLDDERYAKRNRLTAEQTFDYRHAAFCSAFLRGNLKKGEKFEYDAAPGKEPEMHSGIPTLKKGQRFFLAAGMFLPHDPYITPKSYHDDLGKLLSLDDIATEQLDALNGTLYKDGKWQLGEGAARIARAANLHQGFLKASKKDTGNEFTYWKQCIFSYLACLKFADDRLGQLLQGLEDSPHKDNTAIVMIGDNGLHLGTKEHWSKISLWQEATHVPLIIKAPGIQPGICRETVGLVDLYPTLLDLLGMEPPKGQPLDGKSLLQQLMDPTTPYGQPVISAYRTDGLKFCYAAFDNRWSLHDYRNIDGRTFILYDLDNDPYETRNLIPELEKNPEARKAYNRLKTYLDEHLVGKASQQP